MGAVYDATPIMRAPTDIISHEDDTDRVPAPRATHKWLTASVVDDAATVIWSIVEEAQRRDPQHQRTWAALVDGAKHQIECIKAEADARKVQVTIVCDFIHVLEYLWSSAWSFFAEGDPAAEAWVAQKAVAVLMGEASTVAASIRRKATCLGLDPSARSNADRCADYLLAKRDYLDYPRALEQGWPIATGVIEGACRHLVKDRLDRTGARWGLNGAEAILKLRALRSNVTSTRTGSSTSPGNDTECTRLATPTGRCQPLPEIPPREPHPIRWRPRRRGPVLRGRLSPNAGTAAPAPLEIESRIDASESR